MHCLFGLFQLLNFMGQKDVKVFTEVSKTNLINDASKLCQSWQFSRAKLFSENTNRPGSTICIRKSLADCRIYQYTVNLQCVTLNEIN